MATINFTLSQWTLICQYFKLNPNKVFTLLANDKPTCVSESPILTSKEKDDIIKWGRERRFDKIALYLAQRIYQICPFYTKAGYSDILFGTPDNGVQQPGYLGWNVYDRLPKSILSVKERRDRIKDPTVQKELEGMFHLSQQYLIKPMMMIMFEKGVNKEKGTKDDIYQHKMNKYLNLDKLDLPSRPQGMIAAELYQRLCAQGIMEKIKRKVPRVRGTVFHIKKKEYMDYKASVFTKPTRLGFSKGHETTLRILEELVETHAFFQGSNEWKITNEHKNPNKHSFKGTMRYDIALWKNGVLYGLIEFDGKQHKTYLPRWCHKKGIEHFHSLQKKDRIKDADAIKLCNKICLRVGPEHGAGVAQDRIKAQIVDWLI